MTLGTGTKIMLLILCLHICIYIGEGTMDLGTPDDHALSGSFLEDYAKVTLNETGNDTVIISESQGMDEYNITSGTGIIGGTASYYNPLGPVWGAIEFMWGLVSAPLTLYALPIPWEIKLMLFVPLGIMYLIALFSFIRGVGF